MPLNLESSIAWKLLNHLSITSRSSLVHFSRIACNSISITICISSNYGDTTQRRRWIYWQRPVKYVSRVLLISKNTHQGNVVPKTEQLIHPPTTELILWCNLLAAITNSYRKVISIKAPRGGGFFAFLPRALSSLLLLELFWMGTPGRIRSPGLSSNRRSGRGSQS